MRFYPLPVLQRKNLIECNFVKLSDRKFHRRRRGPNWILDQGDFFCVCTELGQSSIDNKLSSRLKIHRVLTIIKMHCERIRWWKFHFVNCLCATYKAFTEFTEEEEMRKRAKEKKPEMNTQICKSLQAGRRRQRQVSGFVVRRNFFESTLGPKGGVEA